MRFAFLLVILLVSWIQIGCESSGTGVGGPCLYDGECKTGLICRSGLCIEPVGGDADPEVELDSPDETDGDADLEPEKTPEELALEACMEYCRLVYECDRTETFSLEDNEACELVCREFTDNLQERTAVVEATIGCAGSSDTCLDFDKCLSEVSVDSDSCLGKCSDPDSSVCFHMEENEAGSLAVCRCAGGLLSHELCSDSCGGSEKVKECKTSADGEGAEAQCVCFDACVERSCSLNSLEEDDYCSGNQTLCTCVPETVGSDDGFWVELDCEYECDRIGQTFTGCGPISESNPSTDEVCHCEER